MQGQSCKGWGLTSSSELQLLQVLRKGQVESGCGKDGINHRKGADEFLGERL